MGPCSSHLMSDDARFYWGIGREFKSHGTALHNLRQFAVGEKHSNTAENFFSIFKRGVVGTYHHLSFTLNRFRPNGSRGPRPY
jgi:hypothetical protein